MDRGKIEKGKLIDNRAQDERELTSDIPLVVDDADFF